MLRSPSSKDAMDSALPFFDLRTKTIETLLSASTAQKLASKAQSERLRALAMVATKAGPELAQ